jgi:predicted enzyme related to lactoylglutathione lyase
MGSPVVHFEIMGGNGPALSSFYAELFGWGTQLMPGLNYTVVDTMAGSGINGGIGTTPDGGHRVLFYAAVPDLKATLDQVEARGGKTVLPVSEIPGIVTLAQFSDPQGNVVGIIKDETPEEQEAAVGPSAGDGAPVSWFEVLGPDHQALMTFYGEIFGWKPQPNGGDAEYIEIDPGTGIGCTPGIDGAIGLAHDHLPKVHLYASVGDLEVCCDKAKSLGGGVVLPPATIHDRIEFAHISDPQDNVFGIWRPLE